MHNINAARCQRFWATSYWKYFTFLSISIFLFFSVITCDSLAQPTATDNAKEIKASTTEIAEELTNPLSNLQFIQVQWNKDRGLGVNQRGSAQQFQISPKFKLNVSENWAAITRVNINAIKVQNINGINNSGIGPTQIETYLTLKSNKEIVWGVGPYLQVPGGSDFGSQQWGGGLRAVAVATRMPWTFGMVGFQSWSLGGYSGNGTMQSPGTQTANNFSAWPYVAYVTDNAWLFILNSESVYNYDARRTVHPLNAQIGKVMRVGKIPVALTFGARYVAGSYPQTLQYPGTPQGWGARIQLIFVFSNSAEP